MLRSFASWLLALVAAPDLRPHGRHRDALGPVADADRPALLAAAPAPVAGGYGSEYAPPARSVRPYVLASAAALAAANRAARNPGSRDAASRTGLDVLMALGHPAPCGPAPADRATAGAI